MVEEEVKSDGALTFIEEFTDVWVLKKFEVESEIGYVRIGNRKRKNEIGILKNEILDEEAEIEEEKIIWSWKRKEKMEYSRLSNWIC